MFKREVLRRTLDHVVFRAGFVQRRDLEQVQAALSALATQIQQLGDATRLNSGRTEQVQAALSALATQIQQLGDAARLNSGVLSKLALDIQALAKPKRSITSDVLRIQPSIPLSPDSRDLALAPLRQWSEAPIPAYVRE